MSWEHIEYQFPEALLFHKELLWVDKDCNVYFAFKLKDEDDWSYYSGNGSHALDTGLKLTYRATEVLAQTNYLTTSRDSSGKVLAILSTPIQAKYARLYVETGAGVTVHEWHASTFLTAHEIVSGSLEITDLLSDAPLIKVTANSIDRIKIGKVGDYYGLFGYDGSSALMFELSDYQRKISGFSFDETSLYTGSKTVYNDTNAGIHVGTDGIGIGNNVFTVSAAGALVATSATITGDITATSGYFTNVTLGKTGVASGTLNLQMLAGGGDTYIAAGKTDFTVTDAGFILGLDDSDSDKAKLYLGDSTSYMYWNGVALNFTKGTLVENTIQMYTNAASLKTSATAGDGSASSAGIVITYEGVFGCGANQTATVAAANANVRILADGSAYFKGAVTADTGYLGGTSGWVITANYIKDVAGVVGLSSVVTAGDDIRFWAGHATPASAPFYVTEAGALVSSNATISGAITATSGYFQTVTLGKTGVASGTLTLQLNDGTGDTYIAAGKTDFTTTDAGFILGLDDSDSNKAKFYIGDATSHMEWNGSNLLFAGNVYKQEIDGSSSVSLTALQVANSVVVNYGQTTEDVLITLPAAAEGLSFIAMVGTTQANYYWSFTGPGGEEIYFEELSVLRVGIKPTVGSHCFFYTVRTGVSTWRWTASLGNGKWAAFYALTLSTNTNNYNVKTSLISAGWDQICPVVALVTVNNGVDVGSTSTSTPAMQTGTSYPVGSSILIENNGTIAGAGGAGGAGGDINTGTNGETGGAGGLALQLEATTFIINNGNISGGGGGGGGGGGHYDPGFAHILGGGGGGGAGISAGAAGTGTPNGSAGTETTGGAGGSGGGSGAGGAGGDRGAVGTAGSNDYIGPGGSGGAGGAAGACTSGSGTYATWRVEGTRHGTVG